MEIDSADHRGLRRLIERNDDSGLPSDLRKKVQLIVTALRGSKGMAQFRTESPRGWRVHRLKGDRDGVWSVWVSGRQRITFYESDGRIEHINLENYH